ncbi:t-SNARE [Gorgonomyces haynaldii]|nr:t-SNARE [Gorgonomyces haynaldii]
MRDRFNDLQQDQPKEEEKKPKRDKKKNEAQTGEEMNTFFEELAGLREQIAQVKTGVEDIKSIHDRALNNVISEQQNAQIAKELDAAMDRVNRQTNSIRNKLKEMDGQNKQLQKKDPNGNDTKIRISQHGVLTKNFLDVMMEYKRIQELYQDKYKDRMQRQALIVKPNATPEEIERMTDGEKGQMFAKQIMNTGQRNEAKKALEDIQNRHRDVLRIEKSILELQQLFMDMAVLVAAQGEMIDSIAVHVNEAVNDTDAGVKALQQATTYQKKSRKKMCIIIFIIVAIIAVLIAVPSTLKALKFF